MLAAGGVARGRRGGEFAGGAERGGHRRFGEEVLGELVLRPGAAKRRRRQKFVGAHKSTTTNGHACSQAEPSRPPSSSERELGAQVRTKNAVMRARSSKQVITYGRSRSPNKKPPSTVAHELQTLHEALQAAPTSTARPRRRRHRRRADGQPGVDACESAAIPSWRGPRRSPR